MFLRYEVASKRRSFGPRSHPLTIFVVSISGAAQVGHVTYFTTAMLARRTLCQTLGRIFRKRLVGLCQSLFLVALLLDNAFLGRVLEIIAGRNEGAPAMRVATWVHEPSRFFLKASQGISARPAGYELML
jgi:hypothetical protein